MRQSGIKVISRAVAVLRICGVANRGLSLGEIATKLELPRSTVQRIVNALVVERLLQADGSRNGIRIGLGLGAIAAGRVVDVVEVARPFLTELARKTDETVDLAELKGDHLVFVDQVVGSQRLRTNSPVGETFPLHNTANGKAALSLLPKEYVQDVLAPGGVARIANMDRLLLEIEDARRSGLAEDNDEHMEGICAVGTAFQAASGSIFAISIPLPSIRYLDRKNQLAKLLMDCRRQIEMELAKR